MANIDPRTKHVEAYAVLDQLAELHRTCAGVDPDLPGPSVEAVGKTIAALVELIEADHEYDAARIHYSDVARLPEAAGKRAACAEAFSRKARAVARRASALRTATLRAQR
ncbi:hypothetical protein ACQHIH_21445 (plasmid) [Xanthomonas sontii]|uniref:hypothetical protein n=1 Tax=Xanthomonas sontii TaxID=2650745 RepID=UPI003F861003